MHKHCLAITIRQDRLYWLSIGKSSFLSGSFAVAEVNQEQLYSLVPKNTPIVFVNFHPYEHVECTTLPSQNAVEISAIVSHQIKSQSPSVTELHWEWLKGSAPSSHQQVVGMITSLKKYAQTYTLEYPNLKWDSTCSALQGLLLALSHNNTHRGCHLHFDQDKILLLNLNERGFENFRYLYAMPIVLKDLISEIKTFYQWQWPKTLDIQYSGEAPPLEIIEECAKTFNGEVKPWKTSHFATPLDPLFVPLYGVCLSVWKGEEVPQYQIENQTKDRYIEKNLSLWCWALLSLLFLLSCTYLSSALRMNAKANYAEELYNTLKIHYNSTIPPGKPSHFSEISFLKTLEKQTLREKGVSTYGSPIPLIFIQLQKSLSRGPDFQLQEIHCSPPLKKFSFQGTVADLSAYEELDQRLKQNKKWNVMSNFTRSASSKKMDLRLQVDIKELP